MKLALTKAAGPPAAPTPPGVAIGMRMVQRFSQLSPGRIDFVGKTRPPIPGIVPAKAAERFWPANAWFSDWRALSFRPAALPLGSIVSSVTGFGRVTGAAPGGESDCPFMEVSSLPPGT